MGSEVFLKCRVSKGMFSDERVVEITRRGGLSRTFVVHVSSIAEVDDVGNGKLKAALVTRGNNKWVMLPTNRQDSMLIDEGSLVYK